VWKITQEEIPSLAAALDEYFKKIRRLSCPASGSLVAVSVIRAHPCNPWLRNFRHEHRLTPRSHPHRPD
jgi:hypothetical protein